MEFVMVGRLLSNGSFIAYESSDFHVEIVSYPAAATFYPGNDVIASMLEAGVNGVFQRYSC